MKYRRILTISLLVAVMISALILPLQPEAAASSSTVQLKPVADAYVSILDPKVNFGAARSLNVQRSPNIVSYLKFNLTSIPLNSEIVEARLVMNLTQKSLESTSEVDVHLVESSSWDELGITWSNAPSYELTPIALNNRVARIIPTQEWNITSTVSKALSKGILSLALVSYANAGQDTFGSKDSDTAPRLIITYDLKTSFAVTNLSINPPNPTSEDRVWIYADLNSTADKVYLNDNASGIWRKTEMMPLGNGTYAGEVPRSPSGFTIEYYVEASSRLNGNATSSSRSLYQVGRPSYYLELEKKHQELQSQYDDLKQRYGSLAFRYEDLLLNSTETQDNLNELRNGFDNLGRLYSTLRAQYFAKEGESGALRSQVTELTQQRNEPRGGAVTIDSYINEDPWNSANLINDSMLIVTGLAAVAMTIMAVRARRRRTHEH